MQDCELFAAQAPWPVQAFVCQLPVASHVSVSVPQLPHVTGFVWVGAHTPEHTPDTHVWLVHPEQVAPPVPHELVDSDA